VVAEVDREEVINFMHVNIMLRRTNASKFFALQNYFICLRTKRPFEQP
jgi:hypothetical protein